MTTASQQRVLDRLARISPTACGCLLWDGKPRAGGYATAWIDGRERRLARWVLERNLGRALHPGLVTLHSCDTPMCVAIDHLSEGTPSENTADMIRKKRSAKHRGTLVVPNTVGEANAHAKISERDVSNIRARYAAGGVTQQSLADEYGLTQQTIGGIILRYHWRHIP